MELIGSIANQGTLQGQINDANGYLTGVITNAGLLGGQVVAERGLKGDKGDKGDQGEKGDAFTYDDFTPEQLAALKGEKGDKGDTGSQGVQGEKGDPFTYDDFTPEQLAGLKGDKGDKGDQGIQGVQGVQGDPFTYDDFTPEQLASLKGEKGDKGDTGDDGYSPTATVTKSGSTATISITDKNGTTTQTVSDGTNGTNGQDGHSPVVTASKVGKVTTVSVDGSAIATINDGNDGQDGADGTDGYSPSASVSKSGSIATIRITDKNGTTTASVSDGSGVPSGGTSGQVLTKHSATNYDVEWADASGGGAYIVTFTYDDQNETWSCDKTAEEIFYAYESGMAVIGVIPETSEGVDYDTQDSATFLFLANAFRYYSEYGCDCSAEFHELYISPYSPSIGSRVFSIENDTVYSDEGYFSFPTIYIEAEGTSGIWTYRKWSSGKIELWGIADFNATSGTQWVTNLYYTDETVSIPSGLLKTYPEHILATSNDNQLATSNDNQWVVYSYHVNGKTQLTIRLTKPNDLSLPSRVSIYILGTWK